MLGAGLAMTTALVRVRVRVRVMVRLRLRLVFYSVRVMVLWGQVGLLLRANLL